MNKLQTSIEKLNNAIAIPDKPQKVKAIVENIKACIDEIKMENYEKHLDSNIYAFDSNFAIIKFFNKFKTEVGKIEYFKQSDFTVGDAAKITSDYYELALKYINKSNQFGEMAIDLSKEMKSIIEGFKKHSQIPDSVNDEPSANGEIAKSAAAAAAATAAGPGPDPDPDVDTALSAITKNIGSIGSIGSDKVTFVNDQIKAMKDPKGKKVPLLELKYIVAIFYALASSLNLAGANLTTPDKGLDYGGGGIFKKTKSKKPKGKKTRKLRFSKLFK